MTSTNDGKDVKSNQTSALKGKTYYVELYKSLESQLNGECDLPVRTRHLCEAWHAIHRLCQHALPTTHPHLLSWLLRHTARTVLQSQWQEAQNKHEHSKLSSAIEHFLEECRKAISSRNGESHLWEVQLQQRASWFKKILRNPWDHPVLKLLSDPKGKQPTEEEVLKWLKEERGVMFVTRLRQLASSSRVVDIALLLASAVMSGARTAPSPTQTDDKENPDGGSLNTKFADVLKNEAGFTEDVWEIITDIEFVLLHKLDRPRCIELAKQTPLSNGYKTVERLRTRLETSPREKKIWKNAKDVASLIAQMVIARCMVRTACTGEARVSLYCCARALVRLAPAHRLPAETEALAALAATARHLHTFAAAVSAQCGNEMKSLVCELYVRAITAGMNELERLKLNTEKETEARSAEQTLAAWFNQLGDLISDSVRLKCECALTAFSVHPSPTMYDRIKAAPQLAPVIRDDQEPKPEITSEFGSWASDSRSQTNLVKTSETLNMKQQTRQQANVLSTAALTEGEAIGLPQDLCQDLAVLLSGPRLKTLSWDMDRDVLLLNCCQYMERTHGGTRALTTELKYLNLDLDLYQHLPEEKDDENDIYYGIEKGYEHLVEIQQEPEHIWQDTYSDPERTETCSDGTEDFYPVRRKKKIKRVPVLSSDEDADPLSIVAETKKQENKERSHSKEGRSVIKDQTSSQEHISQRQKEKTLSKEKKEKKERKHREKKEKYDPSPLQINDRDNKPCPLSNLLGLKVVKIEDANSIHKKKERRRKDKDNTDLCIGTDSDYDSQGKSSLTSLYSEENESDVLFDGLFSMDEIKSPEKTVISGDYNINKASLHENCEISVSNKGVAINQDVEQKNEKLKINIHNPHISQTPDCETIIDSKSSRSLSDVQNTKINSGVKQSLYKLLECRKQKSNFNDANFVDSSKPNSTVSYVADILRKMKHKNEMEDEGKIKQTVPQKATNVDNITNLSLYKKYSEAPNVLSSEGNKIICEKFQKCSANLRDNLHHSSTNIGAHSQLSFNNSNKNNDTDIISMCKKQATNALTYPNKQLLPKSQTSHQQHFQNFLQELQQSLKGTVKVKKDLKPMTKVTPVDVSKKVDKVPLQCAKQMTQPNKIEDAPNTFARRSYLHKSKQSESKPKQYTVSQNSRLMEKDLQHTMISGAQLNVKNEQNISLSSSPVITKEINPAFLDKKFICSRLEQTGGLTTKESVISSISKPEYTTYVQQQNKSSTKDLSNPSEQSQSIVQGYPKESTLSEKDQQDLILLLRQQSHLKNSQPTSKLDLNTSHTKCRRSPILSTTSVHSKTVPNKSTKISNANLKPNVSIKFNRINSNPQLASATCNKSPEFILKKDDVTLPAKTYLTKTTEELIKASIYKAPVRDDNYKPQNWERVLNAILAQKTPKRGPSALEMTLNKVSLEEQSSTNKDTFKSNPVIEHQIGNESLSIETFAVDLSKDRNTGSSQNIPIKESTNLGLENNLNKTLYCPSTETKSLYKNDISQSSVPKTIQKSKPVRCKADKINTSFKNVQCDIKKLENIMRSNDVTIANVKKKDKRNVNTISTNLKEQKINNVTITKVKKSCQKNSNLVLPNNNKNIPSFSPLQKHQHIMLKRTDNVNVHKNKLCESTITKTVYEGQSESESSKITPICGTQQYSDYADYDLLDELMDDDLRQEIGELSSDEDSYTKAPYIVSEAVKIDNVKPCNVFEGKVSVIKSTEAVLKLSDTAVNKNISELVKQPSQSSVLQSGNCITSEQVNETTDKVIVEKNSQISSSSLNKEQQLPYEGYMVSNADAFDKPNVLIAPVTQQTSLKNVVVIGSDLIYSPYSVINFQENAVNSNVLQLNQNSYFAVTPAQIAMYQTTQFVSPVVNSVIIGNAQTSHHIPRLTTNQDESGGRDNIQKTLKDLTSVSTAKDATRVINVTENVNIIETNMNKTERKVLNELQEKQHLISEELLITKNKKQTFEEELRDKEDILEHEQRIINKRRSIVNREINHRCYYPPIPLNYYQLNRYQKYHEKENDEQMNDANCNTNKEKIKEVSEKSSVIHETDRRFSGNEVCKENNDKSISKNNLRPKVLSAEIPSNLRNNVRYTENESICKNEKSFVKSNEAVINYSTKVASRPKSINKNIKGPDNNYRRSSKRILDKQSKLVSLENRNNETTEIQSNNSLVSQMTLPDLKTPASPGRTLVDLESEINSCVIPKINTNGQSSTSDNVVNIVTSLKDFQGLDKPHPEAQGSILPQKLRLSFDNNGSVVVSKKKEPPAKFTIVDNLTTVEEEKIKYLHPINAQRNQSQIVEKYVENRPCSLKNECNIKPGMTQNINRSDQKKIVEKCVENISCPLKSKSNIKTDVKKDSTTRLQHFEKNKNDQSKVVKLEELPLDTNNALKKMVRIYLPNGKVFKATVHGKLNMDFNTLFDEPRIKRLLLNDLKENCSYTLNIKQTTAQSEDKNEIRGTRLDSMNVIERPNNTETVNLISDDEEERLHCVKTEFGEYSIKNLDSETLFKHQKKLSQRCSVKLIKSCFNRGQSLDKCNLIPTYSIPSCDVLKSNKSQQNISQEIYAKDNYSRASEITNVKEVVHSEFAEPIVNMNLIHETNEVHTYQALHIAKEDPELKSDANASDIVIDTEIRNTKKLEPVLTRRESLSIINDELSTIIFGSGSILKSGEQVEPSVQTEKESTEKQIIRRGSMSISNDHDHPNMIAICTNATKMLDLSGQDETDHTILSPVLSRRGSSPFINDFKNDLSNLVGNLESVCKPREETNLSGQMEVLLSSDLESVLTKNGTSSNFSNEPDNITSKVNKKEIDSRDVVKDDNDSPPSVLTRTSSFSILDNIELFSVNSKPKKNNTAPYVEHYHQLFDIEDDNIRSKLTENGSNVVINNSTEEILKNTSIEDGSNDIVNNSTEEILQNKSNISNPKHFVITKSQSSIIEESHSDSEKVLSRNGSWSILNEMDNSFQSLDKCDTSYISEEIEICDQFDIKSVPDGDAQSNLSRSESFSILYELEKSSSENVDLETFKIDDERLKSYDNITSESDRHINQIREQITDKIMVSNDLEELTVTTLKKKTDKCPGNNTKDNKEEQNELITSEIVCKAPHITSNDIKIFEAVDMINKNSKVEIIREKDSVYFDEVNKSLINEIICEKDEVDVVEVINKNNKGLEREIICEKDKVVELREAGVVNAINKSLEMKCKKDISKEYNKSVTECNESFDLPQNILVANVSMQRVTDDVLDVTEVEEDNVINKSSITRARFHSHNMFDSHVIEIDDSSSDSICMYYNKNGNSVELNDAAKVYGSYNNTNQGTPQPDEKINELKSLLLQEFGVGEIINASNEPKLIIPNKEVIVSLDTIVIDDDEPQDLQTNLNCINVASTSPIKECFIKLKRCDRMVQKYKYLELTKKQCSVVLGRCDNLLSKYNKSTNYDVEPVVMYSPSYDSKETISDNLNPIVESKIVNCDPVLVMKERRIESGRTSPVMDVYDIIASLYNKIKKKHIDNTMSLDSVVCLSEWLETKVKLHSSSINSKNQIGIPDETNIPVASDKIIDNSIIQVISDDLAKKQFVQPFSVPNLTYIMAKYFDDNPLVNYLKPIQSTIKLRHINHPFFKLKRKNNDSAPSSPCKLLKIDYNLCIETSNLERASLSVMKNKTKLLRSTDNTKVKLKNHCCDQRKLTEGKKSNTQISDGQIQVSIENNHKNDIMEIKKHCKTILHTDQIPTIDLIVENSKPSVTENEQIKDENLMKSAQTLFDTDDTILKLNDHSCYQRKQTEGKNSNTQIFDEQTQVSIEYIHKNDNELQNKCITILQTDHIPVIEKSAGADKPISLKKSDIVDRGKLNIGKDLVDETLKPPVIENKHIMDEKLRKFTINPLLDTDDTMSKLNDHSCDQRKITVGKKFNTQIFDERTKVCIENNHKNDMELRKNCITILHTDQIPITEKRADVDKPISLNEIDIVDRGKLYIGKEFIDQTLKPLVTENKQIQHEKPMKSIQILIDNDLLTDNYQAHMNESNLVESENHKSFIAKSDSLNKNSDEKKYNPEEIIAKSFDLTDSLGFDKRCFQLPVLQETVKTVEQTLANSNIIFSKENYSPTLSKVNPIFYNSGDNSNADVSNVITVDKPGIINSDESNMSKDLVLQMITKNIVMQDIKPGKSHDVSDTAGYEVSNAAGYEVDSGDQNNLIERVLERVTKPVHHDTQCPQKSTKNITLTNKGDKTIDVAIVTRPRILVTKVYSKCDHKTDSKNIKPGLVIKESCTLSNLSTSPNNSEIVANVETQSIMTGRIGKQSLVYKNESGILFKGVEYKDPVVGTCYMFPIMIANNNSDKVKQGDEINIGNLNNSINKTDLLQNTLQSENAEDSNLVDDQSLNLLIPKVTYSVGLKRKKKITYTYNAKKYRKSKNIDCPKSSFTSIVESGYGKEYKRLLEYFRSIKFSYSLPFHKDYIDVPNILKDWPRFQRVSEKENECNEETVALFDETNINTSNFKSTNLSLVDELNMEYDEAKPQSNDANEAKETNFDMGFGEGSGRVIQNFGDTKDISKFSAAALSDVKQSQPVLLSKYCNGYSNRNDGVMVLSLEDEIQKINRFITYIKLKDKVRTFFKNSAIELTLDKFQTQLKEFEPIDTPLDLCSTNFFIPPHSRSIVQVVQVGQLPISAAAQNPVTCDPRVTQVSNVSPQFSLENSPTDESQSTIKTEYTELTTADLTLPLVQEYTHQNVVDSRETINTVDCQSIQLHSESNPDEKISANDTITTEVTENKPASNDLSTLSNVGINNIDYQFERVTNIDLESNQNLQIFNTSEQQSGDKLATQKHHNGSSEKTDQIAHAMNAAGITTTAETITNSRTQAFVNILSQKIRHAGVSTTHTATNSFPKTTSINAMALQQALAQILPPPLNQTVAENNHQSQTNPVTPQVLHIVQGKNTTGNQITLVDNTTQQSVISTPNAQVLHIVQNKGANASPMTNGTQVAQSNSFSGLSLVDAGLQQGGNQLLHIVNTGNQKNNNAGQLIKRVNLLTNLTSVQGSNEQKMVQFVCKSADGKAIQLNTSHQRSMVLRLQPIETPSVQSPHPKQTESHDITSSANSTNNTAKDNAPGQQEIKSRSIYEENYAKFIQNSSNKTPLLEKSTSLPKFNQAFGKTVFQDGSQKHNEMNSSAPLPPVPPNNEHSDCNDNAMNIDQIGQISSPPLLLRKSPAQTSQVQTNLVQQIKQTIAPMNIQTMHGGVIYTRQIPVNIGGGQTINLITVPSTELIEDAGQKPANQSEIEPSIIKIVPQAQSTSNTETITEEGNQINVSNNNNNDNATNSAPQPVLTQMRIKLPMLSKTAQMVPGARVMRPSFFQIQRNVIGGANQPVYQQLVLTAAPPLGQQTIRIPQAHINRQNKVPTENQSESQMSTSTLEQLREFDMVLEQVKERSTVQPNTSSSNTNFKLITTSSDSTDGSVSANSSTEPTQQVIYSIGNNSPLNVAYVNRKGTTVTPTTSTFDRSPDSSGIADSPTSSTPHVNISHTTDTLSDTSSQLKSSKVGSKSKSKPKSGSHPPNAVKINTVPPKTSTQKPLEDEQTTQRILYILAEYKEQVENSPDKDKPAPRRRSNPPSNPSGSSKRKKSSSNSRRPGARDMSPVHGDDTCRTMGSEDSSCGTSQGDCNESCLDSHSPQDSPRKVVRKLTFETEAPAQQPRPQPPQRNVIVADGQTITVARGTTGKPTTAVLMPANYILPVSMVKGGQQIAIVTNRGPKLLTVGGGEGGATNALLLQRLIGPAGLKPVLARPDVRHVRLPTAALHNLQTFNLTTATSVQPPDSTASPAPAPTPELIETRAPSSPWTDRESQDVKPERGSSPEGSEPWNLQSSTDARQYNYEDTRNDNMDRTVLVVQKKDGPSQRQHRLTHISAAALRHKYAILEHELRLQKSLSEECEDLGVDSPSASELFPEAELLFAASPAHDHNQEQNHHSHTPQPTLLSQHTIPQPDIDDQIATDQLLPRNDLNEERQELDVNLGLEDVGIVTVSGDGMQATIALDQEEFARSHPNTTFHSEPTDEGEVQPFTISGLKSRHITSTIFHSNSAPATVLMTAPQATVISQVTGEGSSQNHVKYSDIDNMINSIPGPTNNDINLSSVLVKDDGLTRFDSILNDTRELHLSNTASAIVHSAGNATQVIRRVCYDDDKRDRERFLMDESDALIAGDDAKMIAEDSSREATLESMADVDDDRSSPERHAELFWESNSASEKSESRRPLDFSSDSEKCCKSPSYDETNSTDSSNVGSHMRLDSVIKEARGRDRSGSADGSSAEDTHPPLRTYPPKRMYHALEREMERSMSGKTRAGERSPHSLEVRRRASGRGVVKRGCHCCNGSPVPSRPKKPRQRKPAIDFNN